MNKNRIFKKVSFAIIVFALVVGCVVLYQTKTYNNSVLEIYASQQDQYIKLVLDQINLKKDASGSGQEMIRDLGRLMALKKGIGPCQRKTLYYL